MLSDDAIACGARQEIYDPAIAQAIVSNYSHLNAARGIASAKLVSSAMTRTDKLRLYKSVERMGKYDAQREYAAWRLAALTRDQQPVYMLPPPITRVPNLPQHVLLRMQALYDKHFFQEFANFDDPDGFHANPDGYMDMLHTTTPDSPSLQNRSTFYAFMMWLGFMANVVTMDLLRDPQDLFTRTFAEQNRPEILALCAWLHEFGLIAAIAWSAKNDEIYDIDKAQEIIAYNEEQIIAKGVHLAKSALAPDEGRAGKLLMFNDAMQTWGHVGAAEYARWRLAGIRRSLYAEYFTNSYGMYGIPDIPPHVFARMQALAAHMPSRDGRTFQLTQGSLLGLCNFIDFLIQCHHLNRWHAADPHEQEDLETDVAILYREEIYAILEWIVLTGAVCRVPCGDVPWPYEAHSISIRT